MYCIVIQQPMKNTTICTNSEALMFIINPVYIDSRPLEGEPAGFRQRHKKGDD